MKLNCHAGQAATDSNSADGPTANAVCWDEREGLKGCATRTGKPAVALDPLALIPAFG